MTTIQDHLEWVLDHPDDRAAALALIDRLEEVWALSQYTALRVVARMRRESRAARAVAAAAALVDERSPLRTALYQTCVQLAPEDYCGGFVFVVIRGWRPPDFQFRLHPNQYGQVRRWTCTVGARWLLSQASELSVVPVWWRAPERKVPVDY